MLHSSYIYDLVYHVTHRYSHPDDDTLTSVSAVHSKFFMNISY